MDAGCDERHNMNTSEQSLIKFRAKPIIVASHPRSGTHLMIDGLRHFFKETVRKQRMNQPVHDLYVNLDRLEPDHNFRISSERMRHDFETCEQRLIIKTHCTVDVDRVGKENEEFARSVITGSDIVYVVRDVRPVLASYMALRPLKFPDSPVDIGTFLRTDLDGYGQPALAWAKHVSGWLGQADVHVVKFEEMKSDYSGTIERLGAALGMTRTGKAIQIYRKPKSIIENKIRRLLGRQLSSSIDNLRMKIRTPKWREVMSADDLALIREQAGEVLATLGYD